jgi:hypothetical protein
MSAERWHNELRGAKKEDEKFVKSGKKIVKRYRDERTSRIDGAKRYNILWSNVQTMLPTLYGRTPRAQVERRNKDKDPVARTAAQILERALQYEIDHYGDFDRANHGAVLDRLLPGRGVVWVRLEEREQQGDTYTCAAVDYVYWEDFRHSPARTWEEVTWCARRAYMTKAEGEDRFGEEFKNVPLSHEPRGMDELKNQGMSEGDLESMKKGIVWEIWDRTGKKVIFVAEGSDKILEEKADPYQLDNFWPCPRPLYSTQTTDTLCPVADFSLYQDQAEEIDLLTQRIAILTEAVKVVGVYDATQSKVQQMLSSGTDNQLIPVDTWAAFAEKGGLKGVVDFMPLDMVIAALNQCYISREQAKQVVYDVTGLSDIIRGSSDASETATAQEIKSNYATLRLKRMQIDVAQFASTILQIKAQMMCDLYDPQKLVEMSGIMATDDAQYAEQAIQLIKSEPARNYRIEVAADSLVEMDEQAEKQIRTEFMTAFGGVMRDAVPMVQQAPQLGPLIGEVLQFVVRTFKGGRSLENALEQAVQKMNEPKPPQPTPPDPEQVKAQAAMQLEQMRAQTQAAQTQAQNEAQGMIEQFKAQQAQQLEAMRLESAQAIERMKQQAETERVQMKAQIDAETKLQIASMTAQAAEKPAINLDVSEIGETMRVTQEQSGAAMAEGLNKLASATESLAMAAAEMARPKVRKGRKLPSGEFEVREE